ncbi:MAG: hypothetical protein V4590_08885 [Bacteroidota bacterium]
MTTQLNIGGESSIDNYHIGEGFIIVVYKAGYGYLYNAIKPGSTIVDQMIRVAKAEAVEGLGQYIQSHVRGNYYQKLR